MGNSATKESRPSYGPSPRHTLARDPLHISNIGSHSGHHATEGSSRHRGNRHDLSFFGFGSSPDSATALEHRRETRQEREARKLEKERVARVKERERSMKTEHVDGGYLVTQGVYVGTEDFSKPIVRQLMVRTGRAFFFFWLIVVRLLKY